MNTFTRIRELPAELRNFIQLVRALSLIHI